MPGGALHPWRRAALPVAAAVGGVVVSIAVYLAFVHYVGEHMLEDGWVAACAIDIPGSYVIARMIFGRHPAVPFLLLLAISADAIGLACVAVLQPDRRRAPLLGLGLMAVAIGRRAALRRSAASRISGCTCSVRASLSWWALYPGGRASRARAGADRSVFSPRETRSRPVGRAGAAGARYADAVRALVAPPGGRRAPAVRAGQRRRSAPRPRGRHAGRSRLPRSDGRSASSRPSAWRSPAGLHLPHRVGWRELVVVGCTASIGLVFALFFATAVMPPGTLLLEMKIGRAAHRFRRRLRGHRRQDPMRRSICPVMRVRAR